MLGIDGNPLIAHADGEVAVIMCSNPTCTTSTKATIDVGNVNAVDVALLVGNEGNPLVAYTDRFSRVRVAACLDLACGSTSVTTIDTLTNAGSGVDP